MRSLDTTLSLLSLRLFLSFTSSCVLDFVLGLKSAHLQVAEEIKDVLPCSSELVTDVCADHVSFVKECI